MRATRLRELTDDPGTKSMLGFMIACDTIHQQLVVIEELGGAGALPIPNSFPQPRAAAAASFGQSPRPAE